MRVAPTSAVRIRDSAQQPRPAWRVIGIEDRAPNVVLRLRNPIVCIVCEDYEPPVRARDLREIGVVTAHERESVSITVAHPHRSRYLRQGQVTRIAEPVGSAVLLRETPDSSIESTRIETDRGSVEIRDSRSGRIYSIPVITIANAARRSAREMDSAAIRQDQILIRVPL